MSDTAHEGVLSHQVTTYKRSATDLCTAALQAITRQSKKSVLDSILVLFALDVSQWLNQIMFLVSSIC
jgi:hypothetical protein